MITWLPALLALLVSVPALTALAWRDGKRLRAARNRARPWTTAIRRGLTMIVLLPGLLLMLSGLWPAWLLWLTLIAAAGWLITRAFAPNATTHSQAP
ncbi:hypothetical protein [uncultured Abyssibacter sp.]|uniref:hypothetical protein n=1 Tax=uncultured Abyssibacter sp. TaxID=2320202 RepID=UPI0032B2E5D5